MGGKPKGDYSIIEKSESLISLRKLASPAGLFDFLCWVGRGSSLIRRIGGQGARWGGASQKTYGLFPTTQQATYHIGDGNGIEFNV